MAETKEKPRFSIGLPASVYAWLKLQAEREGRSMAGMANKIITGAKEAEEQKTQSA